MQLRHLYILICSTLLTGGISLAQTDAERWILDEIRRDLPVGAEIFWTGNHTSTPFLPAELPDGKTHEGINHLTVTREGLFLNIDGTGKVFKWTIPAGERVTRFVRQDSSQGYGYNYKAFVFSRHDTVFSMGGYGYWNYNWNLRYFSKASRGWEILPVNKRIFISQFHHGVWVDQHRGELFLCSKDSIIDEGLKTYNGDPTSLNTRIFLYRLNLDTRNWNTLGELTMDAKKIYDKGIRITSSPFGEILIQDSKANFPVRFIDAARNRILELKDKELSTRIYQSLFSHRLSGENLILISYFHNSHLTVFRGNKTRSDFRIDSADLKVLPLRLYEPLPGPGISWSSMAWWILSGQTAVIGLLLFLYRRRKQQDNSEAEPEQPEELFSKSELQIIEALASASDHALSTEQIDEILGTANKSVDLKNKRRSLVIRSINQKFQAQFESGDSLIRTARMENDRRMVRYVLDAENHRKLTESGNLL